jgi:hypothetical protein
MLRVEDSGKVIHKHSVSPATTLVPHRREVMLAIDRIEDGESKAGDLDLLRRWVTAEAPRTALNKHL